MQVELTVEEMKQVSVWGELRTNENKNTRDIAEYRKQAFNLSSLQANKLGVMVEYAILKWLQLPSDDVYVWAAFVERKDYKKHLGRPDIANKVEARRANKADSPIPIRLKDVKGGAFVVQGFVDYVQKSDGGISVPRSVELLGWADAVVDYPLAANPWWGNGDSRVLHDKRSMVTLNTSNIRQNYYENQEAFAA